MENTKKVQSTGWDSTTTIDRRGLQSTEKNNQDRGRLGSEEDSQIHLQLGHYPHT
jgi:hypothetical protein